MEKVTRTKVPTQRQLTNILLNLRKKFKYGTTVTFETHTYAHLDKGKVSYQFWIHPDSSRCFNLNSWKECLDKYFELMKEATND